MAVPLIMVDFVVEGAIIVEIKRINKGEMGNEKINGRL